MRHRNSFTYDNAIHSAGNAFPCEFESILSQTSHDLCSSDWPSTRHMAPATMHMQKTKLVSAFIYIYMFACSSCIVRNVNRVMCGFTVNVDHIRKKGITELSDILFELTSLKLNFFYKH